MDDTTAAIGIAEVVDENMTNAARVHAVENGKDLAGFAMVAFGGGAPLHASRSWTSSASTNFSCRPVPGSDPQSVSCVPPSPTKQCAACTPERPIRLRGGEQRVGRAHQRSRNVRPPGHRCRTHVERQVSMRYKGQGWEIPVHLGAGDFDEFAAEGLSSTFTKAYEEFFGRAIDDLPIEAVSWSVRVASVQKRPPVC